MFEYKGKVVELEKEKDELLASKTLFTQQNTSCTIEDLAIKMLELRLNYEEFKTLKEILREK